MGKEIKMLEHHAHLLAQQVDIMFCIGDFFTVNKNMSRGWLLQQIQAAQKGTFAAA